LALSHSAFFEMGIVNISDSRAEQQSNIPCNSEPHSKFENLVNQVAFFPRNSPSQKPPNWKEIPSEIDDVSLLARIAQRDQSALAIFYDRYARIVYAIALKSLRSIEESEEVVLDVFSQVWRIAERYDVQRSKPNTWLFTLARSRILDRLRKLRRVNSSSTISLDALEIQPKADSVDLFEQVAMTERRGRVLAAMQTLPDEQRMAITLAYYQGLTHSEIATQTGLSLGTVKTRIRLGLSKLKSALNTEEDLNRPG